MRRRDSQADVRDDWIVDENARKKCAVVAKFLALYYSTVEN